MKNIIKILGFVFLTGIFIGCEKESESDVSNEVRTGSYSRMLIYGDFIYYVSSKEIQTVDISNPQTPFVRAKNVVGFNIESIFRSENLLFLGSPNNMYIYEIGEDGVPSHRTSVEYTNLNETMPCDPIVVKENFAYVTLSSGEFSGNGCGTSRIINALLVFDISNLDNVRELQRIPMNYPRGLGIDKDYLFVCEGNLGVDVFDIANPSTSVEKVNEIRGFKSFDVIPDKGILMVIGDELELFDYSDINDIKSLSKINIAP